MIRFSKFLWIYFIFSSLVLIPGTFALLHYGLRPAIDFTGGTIIELRFPQQIDVAMLKDTAQKDAIEIVDIQKTQGNDFIVRTKPETSDKINQYVADVTSETKQTPAILRNETVGPVLGKELLQKTLVAGIIVILIILAYVAYAFKNIRFGVSAVVALIHDLLVVLGVFALLGHFRGVEVDTLFVTAFLTTMSFSVHDTIVVFDRIREMLKRGHKGTFTEMCDIALTHTIGRSVTNSLTIIFMLLSLFLMGGETIKWFVLALLVGTISGTYSSPFIATPVLILWHQLEEKRKLSKSK